VFPAGGPCGGWYPARRGNAGRLIGGAFLPSGSFEFEGFAVVGGWPPRRRASHRRAYQRGYITVEPFPSDARTKRIALTILGRTTMRIATDI
jgi:hypothetical protein